MLTLDAFFDDAAMFPPGNLPLAQAVPANLAHRASDHGSLVGPFVVAASALRDLAPLVADLAPSTFPVALTVPRPGAVGVALSAADGIPAVAVRTIEVAVPQDVPVDAVVPTLHAALQARPDSTAVLTVFVELPRDHRRGELIAALRPTAYLAKLRTGGVRAELYPDEAELAAAIIATTRAHLPFKATAGLHHAIRNTEPATGFEQHGFLNVLGAVAAALAGAGEPEVARLLGERNGAAVAAQVAGFGAQAAQVREQFRSVGTCSIAEPLTDLAALDLLPPELESVLFTAEGLSA